MAKRRYEIEFSFEPTGFKIRYFETKEDALRWHNKVIEFAKNHFLHGKIKLFQYGNLVSTTTF